MRWAKKTLMMIAAWSPALALWLAFGMAGGQVSLAAAFPAAALTIAVAAILGLGIWEVCVRVAWPDTFRVRFFAIHILAAIIYSAAWVVGTIALEPIFTHAPMWAILKTPRAITWALTGM